MAKKVKEKDIYQLVNENADRVMAERKAVKPKRDYSRLTITAMFVIVAIMFVEVLMYGYGLYLVTRL